MTTAIDRTYPLPSTERIAELADMFAEGTADEAAEQEVWAAAQMVPALVKALTDYIDFFDDDYGPRADEIRRNARYLIGD